MGIEIRNLRRRPKRNPSIVHYRVRAQADSSLQGVQFGRDLRTHTQERPTDFAKRNGDV